MTKYVCTVCDYVYDPEVGDPDNGIEPGPPSRTCRTTGSAPSAAWTRTSSRSCRTDALAPYRSAFAGTGSSPSANAISSWRVSAPVTKTARRASLANSDGPLSWYQVKAVAPLSAPYCSVVSWSDSLSPSVAGQLRRASPRNLTVLGPICSSVN